MYGQISLQQIETIASSWKRKANERYHFHRNLIVFTDCRIFIVHNGIFRGLTIKEIKWEQIENLDISFNLKAPPVIIYTKDKKYTITISKKTLLSIVDILPKKSRKKDKPFSPSEFLKKEGSFNKNTFDKDNFVDLGEHKLQLTDIGNYSSPSGGYLNYGLFKIGGTNKATGRIKHYLLESKTEETAIEEARTQGLNEPFSVECIDFDMPTQAQIDYANSLGIKIPNGVTKQDVSAILTRYEQDDFHPISKQFALWVDDIGVKFSRFDCLDCLIQAIKFSASEHELAVFYAYYIYERSLNKQLGNPTKCSKYNKIKQWADTIEQDSVKIAKIRQRLEDGIFRLSNHESDLLKFINS